MLSFLKSAGAAAALALGLPAFFSCSVKPKPPPGFTVDFLGTGKSDCIIIRADGHVIINDAAYEENYPAIKTVLDEYGIEKIDCFIVSHFDKDHIGGAYLIVRDYDVGLVIMPDFEVGTPLYKKLLRAVDDTGTSLLRLSENYSAEYGGAKIAINSPEKEAYDDENNFSLITSVFYGGYSFLLAGDAQKDRMREFYQVCEESYTLFKLPHHGSFNKGLRVFITNFPSPYAVYTSKSEGDIDEDLSALLSSTGTTVFATSNGRVRAVVSAGKFTAGYFGGK